MNLERPIEGHVQPLGGRTARRDSESPVGMAARTVAARRCPHCDGEGSYLPKFVFNPWRKVCHHCKGTGERAGTCIPSSETAPPNIPASPAVEKASGAATEGGLTGRGSR